MLPDDDDVGGLLGMVPSPLPEPLRRTTSPSARLRFAPPGFAGRVLFAQWFRVWLLKLARPQAAFLA